MTRLIEQALDGDIKSQTALALSYEVGIVTEVDFEQAIHWWKIAAKSGDPQASEKIKELQAKIIEERKLLNRKALLIGGNTKEITNYKSLLKKLSFHTLCCKSGDEALKMIFQNLDISLVIIDENLERKSALKLAQSLKKSQIIDRARVILTSTEASKELVEQSKEINIERLLVKPIEDEDFLKAVESLMESPRKIA